MQIKLFRLLRIQILLAVVLMLIAWGLGHTFWLSGLLSGSTIAITTTFVAMLVFRRLPEVVPAKMFYGAMVVNEIIKWMTVGILTVLLLPYVNAAALGIGFIVTYLAYFWLILID